MNIRLLELHDLREIQRIHEQYFKDDFEFPDFTQFQCAIIIEENNEIILGAGLRPIAELISITNKNIDRNIRKVALQQMFQAMSYLGNNLKYDQIHAFVRDKQFVNRLLKNEFVPTVGTALVRNI